MTRQPAVNTVGVRRTTRLLKPSARLREAADSTTTARKRKANDDVPRRHVVRKVIPEATDSDEAESDDSAPSLNATNDDEATDSMDAGPDCTDTDEVQAAYDRTKEMGDADREVSLTF